MYFIVIPGFRTFHFRSAKKAERAAEQCFLLSGYRPEIHFDRNATND